MKNNEIIMDDINNASTMNDYFVDITKNLDIPDIEIEQLPLNTDICAGFMEEKTRVIVVMRSRYTLCIKDAVMANFRRVVLDLWRKRQE